MSSKKNGEAPSPEAKVSAEIVRAIGAALLLSGSEAAGRYGLLRYQAKEVSGRRTVKGGIPAKLVVFPGGKI